MARLWHSSSRSSRPGADKVGKGGVVRERETHRAVLKRVLNNAIDAGWELLGVTRSPLIGPAGNVEFLAWLGKGTGLCTIPPGEALEAVVDRTVE